MTGQPSDVVRSRPARRVQQRLLQLVAIALIVVMAWWLRPRDFDVLVFALAPAAVFVYSFRPPTEVSADGIRRPWRRPARLSWDEVAAVKAPALGDTTAQVLRADGRTLTLPGIPTSAAERVAQIGAKPVRPAVAPAPTRVERVPTPEEAVRDRAFRLDQLHQDLDVLHGGWHRLHPKDPRWANPPAKESD